MKAPDVYKRTRRGGQVIVVAVAGLALLCLVAALAIDTGHIFLTRAQLQNASDSASVAAALKLIQQRNAGYSETAARGYATAEANAIMTANHPGARSVVTFGTYASGVFTPKDVGTKATAVQMQVYRDGSAPGGRLALFFAPAAGIQAVDVQATAVAQFYWGIVGILQGSDLRPFAVYEGDVLGWVAGQNVQIKFPVPGQGLPEGQITPGNWGWLNLDGGASGTPELALWIDNGYDGDIVLDHTEDGRPCVWINGTTGAKATLEDNMEALIGKTVFFCIFDRVVEEGGNTNFRIVGFLGFTLTGVNFTGEHGTIDARLEIVSNVPYVERGDGAPHINLGTVQLVK